MLSVEDATFSLSAASSILTVTGPGQVVVRVESDDTVPASITIEVTSFSVSKADFDGDGTVGFSDFLAFAGAFGTSSASDGFDAKFDIDGNGDVGFTDFLEFAALFGKSVA
jgi:hypothetical protein